MTTATATPPTSISVIEEETGSYTPRAALRPAPADLSPDPLAAVQALVDLDDGWDSYGALAPTRIAVGRAWMATNFLCEQGIPPQVFPTRRGGVQLEWHTSVVDLEWEIDPNGSTGVFIFDNHVTGERVDGELPGDDDRLGLALAQV